MDRWPEDRNAPKRLEDILPRTIPVVMPRDQHLDICLSADGRLLSIREAMPPLANYARIPEPTRHDEKHRRMVEWKHLEAGRWE
jgi:hypothetical protein